MDSREGLRLVLVPFFRPNNQPDMSGNPFARLMPHHLRKLDDAIDAILASDWLKAERERVRREAMLEAAGIAEKERDGFLSPEYAFTQPIGSIQERFACNQVAAAIRAAAGGER